jgi:hypothetical protein
MQRTAALLPETKITEDKHSSANRSEHSAMFGRWEASRESQIQCKDTSEATYEHSMMPASPRIARKHASPNFAAANA